MTTLSTDLTQRERELGAIILSYNEVTEQLKTAHERLLSEVGRLRDELGRKNRQLRRRERLAALGELAAGVAHEIRNPLAGIRLFASLLEHDVADRPNAVRLTGRITKGVTSLERIVNDILQFARPAEPKAALVDLDRLIRETIELAAARCERQGVRVEMAGDAHAIEAHTDGALLQRALLNLVLNAVEAAGQGTSDGAPPLVVVGARPGTIGRIVLSVTDNGPGIPSELMDRIFNPFFTTKATGTGLGLAIVHQVVELLGGTIQAANRREGGAVFSLGLPRRLESAERE